MIPDPAGIAMAEAARDPAAFEAALLRALRDRMVGVRPYFENSVRHHIWIDEVRIVDAYPDSIVEIFIRDDRRPECRFVSRELVWSPTLFDVGGTDPDQIAAYLGIFLQEEIDAERYGLSIECEPGVTTPVGNRVVSLEETCSLADFRVLAPTDVPSNAELSVIYEPNREFGHYQSVTLTYRWPEEELVVEESANFRTGLPDEDPEVIEREGWPMKIWRLEAPTRLLVGLWFEDAEVHLHSTTLGEEELLDIACSLERPRFGEG